MGLPGQQLAQVAGGGDLARVRPRRVDARVEGHVGALERVEGEGADHVGGAREAQDLGQGEAARPRS